MFTPPPLSIVIPTHNRSTALQRTLAALASQSYPMQDVQVIVVADACTDNTVEMVGRLPVPYSLQVIEESAHSAAAARNAGAAVAHGDFLLFLDDDVEPTPGLVGAHVSAHQEQPGQLALGPYPPVIERNPDFFRMELAGWWHDHFRALYHPDHRFTYRDICSGNLSLESRVFKQLGGMDPAFLNAGGEDYEFGLRVITAGLEIRFVPEALASHHDNSDLDRILLRARQEGRSDVLIGRRHPEMRPYLALGQVNYRMANTALRNLAFQSASLGDSLATRLRALLNLFERTHLRRAWYKAYQLLHAYWYWRGVADELESVQALTVFLQEETSQTNSPGEIEIDLDLGLEAAERVLDQERPSGMRLCLGSQMLGHVPAHPGIEPLRGVHLRRILANEMALPFLKALALNTARGHTSTLSRQIIGAASPSIPYWSRSSRIPE